MSLTRRGAFVPGLLCAMVLGLVAVPGAAAASTDITMFTCKNTGPGAPFTGAHCRASDAGEGGKFSHVALPEGTVTELSGNHEKTVAETTKASVMKMKTNIGLAKLEIEATGASWTGTLEDRRVGVEHQVAGSGTVTYTGVTVPSPVGKGCKVKGGKIETEKLNTSTAGLGMGFQFWEFAGGAVAKFTLEGCSIALNGAYQLNGTAAGTLDGATLSFTYAGTTGEAGKGPLTLTGPLGTTTAGIEETVTLSGKDPALGDETYTPLGFTTVETP